MRISLLTVLAVAACGDNIVALGPPLAQADHLFIGAHMAPTCGENHQPRWQFTDAT